MIVTSPSSRTAEVAVSYMALSAGAGGCRLLVKLLGRHHYGRIGRLLGGWTMPWLDLLTMRRQLLNLKGLAERDAAGSSRETR